MPTLSPRLRWAVPVAAAALLASAAPVVTALTAAAQGSLPARSASQLLVDVQHAEVSGLSGTVVQTSDLGLPDVSSLGGRGTSFSSLVSGSHTLRLWYADPQHVRLALLGQLGESDLVRNGTDVWSWSSTDNSATHYAAPAGGATSEPPAGITGAGTPMTPQQAARSALKAIAPSTRVTTDPTATVAGRAAYQLVLEPRDTRSLVGSVRIAIDGKTHVPTRVQVFARGSGTPAFEVGFTSFSPGTPPASVFAFTPPPGATVKEGTAPKTFGSGRSHRVAGADGAKPRVVGTGWTSVVVAKVPTEAARGSGSAGQPGQLGQLGSLTSILKSLPPVSGSWGSGHLLQGTLFSAVLTDDGRVAVGAVPPSLLYAALAGR